MQGVRLFFVGVPEGSGANVRCAGHWTALESQGKQRCEAAGRWGTCPEAMWDGEKEELSCV